MSREDGAIEQLAAWRDLALARGRLLACYRLGMSGADARGARAVHACDRAEARLRELGVDPTGRTP